MNPGITYFPNWVANRRRRNASSKPAPYETVESDEARIDDIRSGGQLQFHHGWSNSIPTSTAIANIDVRTNTTWCLTAFWRDTADDLRSIDWRHAARISYPHVLGIAGIAGLVFVFFLLVIANPVNEGNSLCRFDGTPKGLDGDLSYRPWASKERFEINIGFGRLPFDKAKLIDVVWDAVVGRGGQAVMALVSYRVLTSALSLHMETRPVSFGTFEAVTLHENSFMTAGKLIRDFKRNPTARTRVLATHMILVALLIIFHSTLASVMTGYSASFDAEIQVSRDLKVPATEAQKVWYVIHDGSRLGPPFYDNYPVIDKTAQEPLYTRDDAYKSFISAPYFWTKKRRDSMPGCLKAGPGIIDPETGKFSVHRLGSQNNDVDCDMLWHVSNYTHNYGLLGRKRTDSCLLNAYTNEVISLTGPVLNISMWPALDVSGDLQFYFWFNPLYAQPPELWGVVPYGMAWYAKQANDVNTIRDMFGSFLNLTFAYKGSHEAAFFNAPLGTDVTTCRQQGPGDLSPAQYQWGFSFQALVVWIVLTTIWSIIIYAIHINTFLNSKPALEARSMGLLRAVMDIAPLYGGQLMSEDISMKSDARLRRLMNGGTIAYQNLTLQSNESTRLEGMKRWWAKFSFKQWLRTEWPWLVFFTVWFILMLISLQVKRLRLAVDWRFGQIVFVSILPILAVGKAHRSRWLFLAFCLVVYVPAKLIYYRGIFR